MIVTVSDSEHYRRMNDLLRNASPPSRKPEPAPKPAEVNYTCPRCHRTVFYDSTSKTAPGPCGSHRWHDECLMEKAVEDKAIAATGRKRLARARRRARRWRNLKRTLLAMWVSMWQNFW